MKPIYKDSLGRPNATATISVFGADYGTPGKGYLSLSAASDCPSRKWDYVSKDVTAIVDEMTSEGWECTVDQDGYGAPRIKCIHTATQALIDAAADQSNNKFANAQRGFIRFGKCPNDGYSINHRDKTPEAGVSVFEAEFVGKEYRLIFNNHILESSYLSVADRPAYRIYGEVVGTGADGEPVLKVTKSAKL
jgi:hypothetical protein